MNRKSFLLQCGVLGAGVGILPTTNIMANPTSIPEITLNKKKGIRVAHLTDIHFKPELVAEKGLGKALQLLNNLNPKPDFIMNGGDSIMNAVSLSKHAVANQWKGFKRILAQENSLPIHHCIGNHDLFGWAIPSSNKTESKNWTLDEYNLKRAYYSFQEKSWKFIVLDSIQPRGTVPGYHGQLDDIQMLWLENELNQSQYVEHICIVSHIPILAACTLFDSSFLKQNHWFVPDNTLHADAVKLRDLFYKNGKVRTCLSGHIHLIDHVNYLGTDYYCNGAVSGGWWKGDYQQFPPSVVIMDFFDDGSTKRTVHYYDWNV